MKWVLSAACVAATMVAASLPFVPAAANAYTLRGSGCGGDGSGCRVYCDNGQLAGEMFYNGSVWTDGVKWDESREGEARKIVAANGSECR